MTEPTTHTGGRKVVLYTLMSLDGAVDDPARFFAGAQPGDAPEFDSVMSDNLRTVTGSQDAVLLGRNMYDEWSGYWPKLEHEQFGSFINNVKKYVVTSRPLTNGWQNAEAVTWPVADLLRELKAGSGGDIGVHGSIQLAQSLLAAGLIDELRLLVGPAFGFPGRRLFDGTEQVSRLELLDSTPTPSGSQLLAYRLR